MVLTYSRATPSTLSEQIFAVIALMTLGCVYAYAIGSICGIISTMDPAATEFRNTKDLVKMWSLEMRMKPELRADLFEYLDECRSFLR